MTFFVRGFWGPFLFFCFFWASEAHYGKTYLLRVVKIFDKDHFSLYDFFCPRLLRPFCFFSGFRGPFSTNLFTPGGNDFRQGSFFILCFFCPPRLLRPFLLLWLYIATVFVWLRNEENCLWLTLVESDWSSWVAPSLLKLSHVTI